MITKEEFEKAVEVCTNSDMNCEQCPLNKKIYKCGVFFTRYIKENEPAPTADVQEVKRGYWIPERDPDENNRIQCFHCSVCDDDFHYIGAFVATKYCPNCGARMDGGSNDG